VRRIDRPNDVPVERSGSAAITRSMQKRGPQPSCGGVASRTTHHTQQVVLRQPPHPTASHHHPTPPPRPAATVAADGSLAAAPKGLQRPMTQGKLIRGSSTRAIDLGSTIDAAHLSRRLVTAAPTTEQHPSWTDESGAATTVAPRRRNALG